MSLSRIEVHFACADPVVSTHLREINDMDGGPDKDEIIGALMVHLGVLWQTKAAARREYARVWKHNRRKPVTS